MGSVYFKLGCFYLHHFPMPKGIQIKVSKLEIIISSSYDEHKYKPVHWGKLLGETIL